MDFSSDNPYFYFIPPKNISDKFTTIRDTCRFLQLGFVSSMSFEEKLSLPNANYNRIYKSIVELIPNDWIQLFKTKTSQQSLLKVFNLTTEAQKKLKIFKNFQIKKSTSLFNLITRIIINLLNLFHGQIILKGILFSVLKIFSNWFKKCSDCYIFLIWYKLVHFSLPRSSAIHRMGNTPTTLCPRCKEREESHPHFIFL